MVDVYNKAVRDRIPEIIRGTGKDFDVKQLDDQAFLVELENKLIEEINEYGKSKSVEELVDIVEIVYRLLELRRIALRDFEEMRITKRKERGGFQNNLFLIQVS